MAAHLITILLLTTIHHSAGDDRSSLISFLAGLTPHSALSLTNWKTSPDVCNWTGVYCHHSPPSQRVAELHLSDRNLHGKLSPFLSNLSSLEVLDLSNNFLAGTIPPELGSLSGLKQLSLSSNLFSGTIPFQLGFLNSLNYLYLSNNNLSADDLNPFFTSLSNCSGLQELGLDRNGLRAELPPSIGDLSVNLSQLYLDGNQITGSIHPNISNLVNLTYLDLSNNEFNGSIPPEIGRLCKLERLYLSNNRLTGQIPPSFGKILQLVHLDVSDNELSGSIPDAFGHLSQLWQLLLNGNRLSGQIPPSLGNCTFLELLDLSYNQLTGEIPPEIVGLPSLELYLNLSNNNLHGYLPLEMSNMGMILALDLSSNNLSGMIPSQIGSCVALEYLYLSKNSFGGHLPSSIGALPNLRVLDLSSNELVGAMPESLKASSTLRYLNVSFNNFSGIIPGDGVFKSLGGSSFFGNPGLCGYNIDGITQCRTDTNHRLAKLIRISLSIFGTVIVLLTLFFIACQMMKRRSSNPKKNMDSMKDFISNHDYPRLSYQQLVEATDGFADTNLIGSGRFGRIYKGNLRTSTKIAVKVLDQILNCSATQITDSFKRECEVLKRTKHRNLIKIVTACSRPDFKALVLPLMPNGSLERWLYHTKQAELSLELVVRVLSDVAEGTTSQPLSSQVGQV